MNSITFFLFFIPILSFILLGINLIFAPHNPYQEKSSTFECGFHSFLGQNRTQFNISFFVFGLLFLVFDLELVMALPGLINIYIISEYGISIMLIFFAILTVGFAFELGRKALNIESRQNINERPSSIAVYLTSLFSRIWLELGSRYFAATQIYPIWYLFDIEYRISFNIFIIPLIIPVMLLLPPEIGNYVIMSLLIQFLCPYFYVLHIVIYEVYVYS